MSSGLDMSFVIGRSPDSRPQRAPVDDDNAFRVLVLGDFSGRGSRGVDRETPPSFTPVKVDIDTFDAVLAKLSPDLHLNLTGTDQADVRVGIRRLEDFEPDALFARMPLFRTLRDLRSRLLNPATFEAAAAELRALDEPGRAGAMATQSAAATAPDPAEDHASTMARLLGGTLPATAPASRPMSSAAQATTVDAAVDRLIRQMVSPHIVTANAHLQQPLVDSVDRAIADAVRAVLHHPDWRALEGHWRSVDQFVRTVEMDGRVVLELVDATAADLLQSLAESGGDAQRMPLARTLAGRRLHDGEHAGCAILVGLHEFGSTAAELALLAGLGALAANEGAVFIAAAAPALALVDAPDVWADAIAVPNDPAAQARWAALRASWVAPSIGLVWPRLIARLPYGARNQPVSAFAFEELSGPPKGLDDLPWRLASLDVAALLARAFVESGWALEPESAVTLDDLPAFVDRRGSEPRAQAVAEVYMSERQAQAVHAAGVMALISHRGLPQARLAGWRSISSKSHRLQGRWQA